ncbi:helix-turn-helix domain-containing protein [Xanthocytophaga agilis]|uniref:Helix-turn-helix domain-containing protein n=1 Tax=Xanthocytophaga agilis TaxID=3048010 RepID=A0AAE3UCM2_9BACT|nr:helix-turn-helix domain-containing protein [Xanthocytophaga agilis]MDJ1500235.1 helix-turn-helix domain-containing protein [Xanthocytophaga agilis]
MLERSLVDIPLYRLEECSNGSYFIVEKWTYEDDECPLLNEPHRNDGYGVDLLLTGSANYSIDFKEFTVHAPALVLIGPEQIHKKSIEPGTELITIAFMSYFLTNETEDMVGYLECMLRSNVIELDQRQLRDILPLTEYLLRESETNQPYKDSVVRNLLNTFLIACARMQKTCVSQYMANIEKGQLVSRFRLLVNQHFAQKVQVSQYAELLHVTPGHLNDTIKAAVGKTAKQIIDEKRVLEAKRLLFWGNSAVKEISWKLNFEDDAYFHRFFKKHTGLTPLEFQLSAKSAVGSVIM